MNAHSKAALQALFVVFLWATSWVLIKFGLNSIPPLTFAGLRYALAFVCLLAFLLLTQGRTALQGLSRRTWLRLLVLGLLFYTGTQGTMFVALAYLPAVTVNLLWSFSSVTVAVMGILWLSERPTSFQWTGIALALAGALLYFYPAAFPGSQFIGLGAAVVGVLTNAGSSILGRDVNRSSKVQPLVVTTISMGVGSILLLGIGLSVEGVPTIDLRGWSIIAWLAVINTAYAFTLWNHTLRTLTAMESSIINGTMLIWIPVLAVLFLGEHIDIKGIVGLVIVGVGSLIVQLRNAKAFKILRRKPVP
jgi:drug/metabolite transporter (DMT)-like permease